MTALRKEVLNYINELPDSKLEALRPILTLLVDETVRIETDLTDEEKDIIAKGRAEYSEGNFISLNDIQQ